MFSKYGPNVSGNVGIISVVFHLFYIFSIKRLSVSSFYLKLLKYFSRNNKLYLLLATKQI